MFLTWRASAYDNGRVLDQALTQANLRQDVILARSHSIGVMMRELPIHHVCRGIFAFDGMYLDGFVQRDWTVKTAMTTRHRAARCRKEPTS